MCVWVANLTCEKRGRKNEHDLFECRMLRALYQREYDDHKNNEMGYCQCGAKCVGRRKFAFRVGIRRNIGA